MIIHNVITRLTLVLLLTSKGCDDCIKCKVSVIGSDFDVTVILSLLPNWERSVI